jgi:D-lyxose ketol-isomerase
MITRSQYRQARARTEEFLRIARLVLTERDLETLEVADFGLGDLEHFGAQITTLVDTGQIVVKVIVNFPYQTTPEHTHPRLGDHPGKEETIRCQWGLLYLYQPGEPTVSRQAHTPSGKETIYTALSEMVLHPGDQVTLAPGTPHWFQGGPEGSVIWSITTKAVDSQDRFTDPDVRRKTVIVEN